MQNEACSKGSTCIHIHAVLEKPSLTDCDLKQQLRAALIMLRSLTIILCFAAHKICQLCSRICKLCSNYADGVADFGSLEQEDRFLVHICGGLYRIFW